MSVLLLIIQCVLIVLLIGCWRLQIGQRRQLDALERDIEAFGRNLAILSQEPPPTD